MRTVLRRIASGLSLAAILVALVALFNVQRAAAQGNPCFPNFTVTNTNVNCTHALVTLYDAAGNTMTVQHIDPNGFGYTCYVNTMGGAPVGVISAGGNKYPFIPAGQPGFGCTGCITVPSSVGGACCVNVCYGSIQQGIGITGPCGPPCLP